MTKLNLIFLGCGGGRWVTITQKLGTGGFRLHSNKKIHIDPGPGAVTSLRDNKISALDTDAVIVSHCHPDHYIDAEVLIEAMTNGMTRSSGVLISSESVIHGKDGLGPAISKYHQTKLGECRALAPGGSFDVFGMKLEVLPTRHSDPTAIGFKFHTERGVIAYTSDTEYFEGISDYYKGSRVIIMNIIRPRGERIKWHLCGNDAIRIVEEVEPELVILNHFGMKMIGVKKSEAERIERKTGVKTISASDGSKIEILDERFNRDVKTIQTKL